MGRSIEAQPLDARILGPDRARLNPPYLKAPTGMAVTQADYRWMNLMARHPRGLARTVRVQRHERMDRWLQALGALEHGVHDFHRRKLALADAVRQHRGRRVRDIRGQ
jgi:hypothetical protein